MRVTGSGVYARPPPVPKLPPGLVELMEDLTKTVLKYNPANVYEFCADHMHNLLELRDGQGPKKPLTLEQKIARAQEKIRERAEQRRLKYDEEMQFQLLTGNIEQSTTIDETKQIIQETLQENSLKAPIHHEKDLTEAKEVEIFHTTNDQKSTEPIVDEKITGVELKESPLLEEFEINHGSKEIEREICGIIQEDEVTTNEDTNCVISTVSEADGEIETGEPLIGDDNIKDKEATSNHIRKPRSIDFGATNPKGKTDATDNYNIIDVTIDKTDNTVEITKTYLQTDDTLKTVGGDIADSEDGVHNKLDTVTKTIVNIEDAVVQQHTSIDVVDDVMKPTLEKIKDVETNVSTNNSEMVTDLDKNLNSSVDIIVEQTFKINNVDSMLKNVNNIVDVAENETGIVDGTMEQVGNVTVTKNMVELDIKDIVHKPADVMSDIENNLNEKPENNITENVDNFIDIAEETITDIVHEKVNNTVTPIEDITSIVAKRNSLEVSNPTDLFETPKTLNHTASESVNDTGESNNDQDEESIKTDKEKDLLNENSSANNDGLTKTSENLKEAEIEISVSSDPLLGKNKTEDIDKTTSIEINVIDETAADDVLNNVITTEQPISKGENIASSVNINLENIASVEPSNSDSSSSQFKQYDENNSDAQEKDSNISEPTFETISVEKASSADESSIEDSTDKAVEPNAIIETGDVSSHSIRNSNTMDLETAAITIQKVFRTFLFKSRASTFDDTSNDEINLTDDENEKDEIELAVSTSSLNKERRTLGISRMDTVLQTVNEEKSLSLSTDDSSTLSSAATVIQAHVRGFLVRNKLNSNKTPSTTSLVNSDGPSTKSLDAETDLQKNKTVLNIHIVPEGEHFLSRDESLMTSMDLSLDISPPSSSVNLHPLGYDKSEPRKQLKREDAIQSLSPPSNNSGKLSEDVDSVKEMPINEVQEQQIVSSVANEPRHETDMESRDTSPTKSTTVETVIEAHKLSRDTSSSPEQEKDAEDNTKRKSKRSITKMSSDESDVVTPYIISDEKNSSTDSDNTSKLLHSGEFHDVLLPTKVSRCDTSVGRGE